MWRNLLRASLIAGLGILLGRLAGFYREVLLAHTLGLHRAADLAVLTLTLPDLFTNALVGGAMGVALVPEFKGFLQGSPDKAQALLVQASVVVVLVFSLVSAVVAWSGDGLVRVLAPGFAAVDVSPAARLVAVSVWALPLTAAAAVTTAYLQAHDRFMIPALGTLIFNAGLIVALWAWVRPDQLFPLALAVAAAAGVRWFSQLANLTALPAAPRSGDATRWYVTGPLVKRYVQALASFGLLMLAPVVGRAFASLEDPGAVAAINYAYKFVALPMGVAVSVLAIVLLPRFAELHAQRRDADTLVLARQGIWLTWAISVPITLSMGWFSLPLVQCLFGHGAMDDQAVRRVAGLAAWYMLALPANGVSVLLYALLSARGDTARPVRACAVVFLGYGAAAWAGQRLAGLTGVVLAAVLLEWAACAVFAWILRRHHGLNLLAQGLGWDLLLLSVAGLAGFAPVALLAGRNSPPGWGLMCSAGGGAVSLLFALVLRYRVLPDGLRTFYGGIGRKS